MENLKKFASSLIAFMMVATSTLSGLVHAQGALIDDPEFDSALDWMYTNGMTSYSAQEDFMPFNNLTREQAAKFYAEFAETELGLERDADAECNFEDLEEADSSLTDSIVKACEMGLIKGDGNMFLPKDEFTRAQAFTVLVRATDGEKSEDVNPWWRNYFEAAQAEGYTVETDVYDQDRATQRYEVALMLYRAAQDTEDTEADDGDDLGDLEDIIGGIIGDQEDEEDTDTEDEDTQDEDTQDEGTSEDEEEDEETEYDVEGGMVEVALNPSSPSDQSIPAEGRVRYATIDVAAGDSDVELNTINLIRKGLGERDDISRVWLEEDNKRVSSRQTIRRDETVDLRMDRNYVIQAWDVVSLDLIVSMDAGDNTGGEHSFVIESANDIESDGEVVGNFPIRTSTMRTSNYSVASLSIDGMLQADEEENTKEATYNVGETDRILGEFDIENTHADRDVQLRRITMRQNGDGDVAASLDNLGLYVDGQEITKEILVNDREVTFVIDRDVDYTNIEAGSTEYIEIRADIIGSETDEEDYEFEIRRGDDVYAIETKSDFATQVSFYKADDDANEENYGGRYVVEGGDLRLARDTDVSTSESYAPGSSNVVLLSAEMSVDEPVVAEDGIRLDVNDMDDNGDNVDEFAYMEEVFSSLRLVIDGQVVDTYTPNADDTQIEFESTFDVHEDSTVQVQANVRSNVSTYKFDSDVAEGDEENLSKYVFKITDLSNDRFEDLRYIRSDLEAKFTGTVDGVDVTIEEADMNVTRNDGLNAETIVQGAKDVVLYGFRVREKDTSDIRVNNVEFTFSGGVDGIDSNDIQNIRLYRDGEEIAINGAGDFNFNSISEVIGQNERSNFELVADVASSIDTGVFHLEDLEVQARDLSSNNTITKTAGKGAEFTVKETGGFDTIAKHTDSANQSILVPSEETTQVYKLEMEPEYDDIKIEDLVFENTATNKVDFSSALRNAELVIDGSSYEGYYDGDDGEEIVFDNVDHVLKADETTNVDVRLSFYDVDEEYGNYIKLELSDSSELESDSTGINVDLEEITLPEASETHMLAKTKPVLSLKDNGGAQEATFAITADEANSLDVNSLTFEAGSDFDAKLDAENIANNLEIDFGSTELRTADYNTVSVDGDEFTVTFDNQKVTAGSEVEIELNSIKTALTAEIDNADTETDYDRRLRITKITYYDGQGDREITDDYDNVGLPTDRSEYTYEDYKGSASGGSSESVYGVVDATESTSSIDTALASSTTSTVTLTAKDEYGNLIEGYNFHYDVTVTDTNATTDESYTVDGTSYTGDISNEILSSSTDVNGEATFDITIPTVDSGDGVTVDVLLDDGSTELNTFSFTAS